MNDAPQNSSLPGLSGSEEELMRTCPYCLEQIRAEAVRCRHCRTWLHDNPLQHEWFRSSDGRLAGVCQGLSDQFHVSATLLRIMFVLLTAFGAGTGLIIYLSLWFIMPLSPAPRRSPRVSTRGEGQE